MADHLRIAKELAGERFGPNKKIKRDMLGSFVAHGLTQEEAESEILVQLSVTIPNSSCYANKNIELLALTQQQRLFE
jgi:hypothetical protein